MMELITYSRTSDYKLCPKRHWFAYVIGLRRKYDATALRMGSAMHAGLEACSNTDLAAGCDAVRHYYDTVETTLELQDWQFERETIIRLLCGHDWRWGDSGIKQLVAEQSFRLPLINPETGAASRTFEFAGKIDGIVELEDGKLAVMEHKLLGEDITEKGNLWQRVAIDTQISLYVLAARRLGYDVSSVLYNVLHKPTIKPAPVPLLDDLGVKVVLDKHGNRVMTQRGQFRQTGDKEKGYVLQERAPTAEEWGERLYEDIAKRPEYYYARREVARLDDELAECEQELWDVARTIADAKRLNRWYRVANKNTCGFCGYFDLCTSKWKHGDALPDGFEILADKHPELELNNASSSQTPTAPTAPRDQRESETAAA